MIIIDAHAHLSLKDFDKDLHEVVKRAKKAGVVAIVCNGLDSASNRKVLELSKEYSLIKPALGFFPTDCEKVSDEDFNKELEFIKSKQKEIIAIGEVGLDKKHFEDFEKQKACFRKIIRLSKELDKPLIIHSRFAEKEVIEMLEEEKAEKVVIHCFCGKKKLVQRCIDNKWCLSIPTIVVRSQQFQETVAMCPLKQLLTETDSPLLPHDTSLERNEPAYIVHSLEKIAEIKGLDVEELSKIIYSNYQRVFL